LIRRGSAAPGFPLRLEYGGGDEAASLDDLLAVVEFCGRNGRHPADPRRLSVALPPIAGDNRAEIWRTDEVTDAGWEGSIGYACGRDALFGHLIASERASARLSSLVDEAYREVLGFAASRGFPHLLRVWNHVHDIHGSTEGMERYRAFCVGRARAFDAAGISSSRYPAASAIGSRAEGFILYFLAARSPGQAMENPRQISAYRYPRRYGPRSPSFSRALLKEWSAATALFVSGTASVVGHETRHAGVAEAQLEETLANADALIGSAIARWPRGRRACPTPSLFKLYVRDPRAVGPLAARLRAWAPAHASFLFLQGDICRRDLAVELEALGLASGRAG
jgi:chorismate lyase/3-hydroxybenzoate synthase